jgi:hypothetical protein
VTVPLEAVNVSLIHAPLVPVAIVNTELLTSVGLPSVSLTRTRQLVEGVLGTVHVYEPLSVVLAITLVQLVPLFVEYSIRTVPLLPDDVQVILELEPTTRLSPPFGEVTVIDCDGTPVEVYVALHPANTAPQSVVNVMSMLPPLDVNTGGSELPLYVPSRGDDVVAPLYTLTISDPASVLNEVNVRVMDVAPGGCISF